MAHGINLETHLPYLIGPNLPPETTWRYAQVLFDVDTCFAVLTSEGAVRTTERGVEAIKAYLEAEIRTHARGGPHGDNP